VDLWTSSSKSKSRGRHAQSRYDKFRLQLEIRKTMEIGLAGKTLLRRKCTARATGTTIGACQIVALRCTGNRSNIATGYSDSVHREHAGQRWPLLHRRFAIAPGDRRRLKIFCSRQKPRPVAILEPLREEHLANTRGSNVRAPGPFLMVGSSSRLSNFFPQVERTERRKGVSGRLDRLVNLPVFNTHQSRDAVGSLVEDSLPVSGLSRNTHKA
jgi:hypothetical protein